MDSCPICGGEGFDNVDGHYYCLDCGTQSQEHRDEIVDEDEAYKDYNNLQILKKKGVKRKADSLEEEESIDVSYHEGWQMVYLALLDRMIELGFDPSIKKSGKLLWFMYLSKVFQLQLDTFNFVDTLTTRAVYDRYRSTSQGQVSKRKFVRTKKPSLGPHRGYRLLENSVLSQRILLILLYFSLLFSGQFLPLHDLLSLVQSGKLCLPYDSARITSKSLRQILIEYQNAHKIVICCVPLCHKMENIRNTLGIPTNKFPVDHVTLGGNLLEKMLLPPSLRPYLKRLLMICHSVSLRYHLTLVSSVAVRVMAVIVVLVKLVYRLDDEFEQLVPRHGTTEQLLQSLTLL